VKLRGTKDNDGGRSSSGNWSGSSSTRASLDSDHTKTGSAGSSLSPPSRRQQRHPLTESNRSLDSALSDSGSHSAGPPAPPRTVSQNTASPDDVHQSAVSDTSSIYSCDAEGYYTSFHIDSGLKTLKVTVCKFASFEYANELYSTLAGRTE
jgi:NHS-like